MRYQRRFPIAPAFTALFALALVSLCILGAFAGAGGASAATARRATTTAVHARSHCVRRATHSRRKARRRACTAKTRRAKSAKPLSTRPAASAATPRASRVPSATSPVGPPEPTSASAIAAALATPCQNTELVPEEANIPLVREAVLCLINRERAQSGESPLQSNPDLQRAAEGHDGELISDDYFAHVSPQGETPVDRVRADGYIPSPSDGYVIGENLAWGTFNLATPQAIVAAWIASPGHLANILEAQYRETGIAIEPAVPASLADSSQGATYAQEFGVIIR